MDEASGSVVIAPELLTTIVRLVTEATPGVAHLNSTLPGRVRWDGQEAPLVRPGRGIAYVTEAPAERWSPLAERVAEALCNPS